MSECRVNKEHPDYPSYKKECEELRKKSMAELAAFGTPTKFMSNDDPSDEVFKRFTKGIKAIQERYKYLFK